MSKRINIELLIYLIIFMIISIITINSSMIYTKSDLGNLPLKQTIWYLISFIFLFISLKLKINCKYSNLFYILNIILLILVLKFSYPINGSRCWLIIPKLGSFQPSEFMKISLIISTSKIVSNYAYTSFKGELLLLLKLLLLYLLPIILTFLEPDTGVVFIYLIILFSILFISPLRRRYFILLTVLLIIITSLFLYIYFFKQDMFISIFGQNLFYRINRLLDWKNKTGMQLENSLVAIGSSGIYGHGYLKTPIYFPESNTDFIFSVYSSNFGLIASLFLILMIIMFDRCLIKIAKNEDYLLNKYIIIGTAAMLIYQQIQNIGMTIGILPITGITLPLISYGGSSLISYFLLFSIIINKKRGY